MRDDLIERLLDDVERAAGILCEVSAEVAHWKCNGNKEMIALRTKGLAGAQAEYMQAITKLRANLAEKAAAALAERREGWALVPRAPTEAMVIAGIEFQDDEIYGEPVIRGIYAEMLAAALKEGKL